MRSLAKNWFHLKNKRFIRIIFSTTITLWLKIIRKYFSLAYKLLKTIQHHEMSKYRPELAWFQTVSLRTVACCLTIFPLNFSILYLCNTMLFGLWLSFYFCFIFFTENIYSSLIRISIFFLSSTPTSNRKWNDKNRCNEPLEIPKKNSNNITQTHSNLLASFFWHGFTHLAFIKRQWTEFEPDYIFAGCACWHWILLLLQNFEYYKRFINDLSVEIDQSINCYLCSINIDIWSHKD